ncbi:peroxisomal biogenesis factor 11 [Pseudohyphozyma bogoriensis]|nr:peroxisomal biogenesis factor 11 [Pseudohyphozyma bogoriensis]
MAAAIHQVVLHPAITSSLKVGSTTVGRDKLYRAIQYAARALAFYGLKNGLTTDLVARLSALKSALALSRKLMRIGKPLEHAQAAVKALDVSDPFLRITAFGRQIGYAGYLVNDMIVWAHTAKVNPLSPTTAAKVNRRAAQFWFSGILFSLLSSVYKLNQLGAREKSLRKSVASEKESERKAGLKTVQTQQAATRYQLVQDGLDVLLPSGTLGYHHLDDGVLGVVGFVTSLMGLRTQTQKVLGVSAAK